MKYKNIEEGIFLKRDNRFIAEVKIKGKTEICHVKNTGRCRELLIEGTKVYLEPSDNEKRKTGFSLVTVDKCGRLINMDSQMPNKVVEEAVERGKLFENATLFKREYKYGRSRFDFYMERECERAFIEVKGVTLENNNIVSFPDAPSERAVKHIKELEKAVSEGYKAYILFVVQMSNVNYFVPNSENHREFAEELKRAAELGVNVIAYDCRVTKDEVVLGKEVNVCLKNE